MKNVIIIGASGHGKVIADIVRAAGDNFIGFLDDDAAKDPLGPVSDYVKYPDCAFILGIGNPTVRERLSSLPCAWHTAIHPTAVVSPSAVIGEGTVVMPNAVINAEAVIGRHCIINTASVVEHENRIADFVHISVGTHLGGNVCIGERSWIGIGANVKNNTSVCADCMVGAGAAVVKSITEPGTYAGVPAKRLK